MTKLHKDIVPNPKYDSLYKKIPTFPELNDNIPKDAKLKNIRRSSIVDIRLRFLKEIRVTLNKFKRDGGSFVRTAVDSRMCSMRLSLGVSRKESKVRISDLQNKAFGKTAFFKKYSITMMHSLCLIYGIYSFGKHSTDNVDEFLNFIIEEDDEIAIRVKEQNEKDRRDSIWS